MQSVAYLGAEAVPTQEAPALSAVAVTARAEGLIGSCFSCYCEKF